MDSKQSTVLVVEDDHLNMKLMRSILGLGQYRILEAIDAENGLKLAAEQRPDLILMDLQLPGLDGLSATRRLKADPDLRHIPVIALTGLAMDGDREKALEAGCDDYISKPIRMRGFLESIGRYQRRPSPPSSPREAHPLPAPSHQGRILVVDDDPKNVKLVAAILGASAYECLPAYGGREALQLAREKRPDLILLDIMMPDIDGYQVTRELKAALETAAIPIVMITSLNGEEDKAHAMACGADEFLTKPVNAVELLARVNTMLRLRQYREQLTLRSHSGVSLAGAGDRTGSAEESAGRQQVLLVEDSEKDRRLLAGQLEGQPYAVFSAGDGEAALQGVMAGGIDLVLLDIFLPGTDGFEVCRRIKSHPETRDVQVVLVTGLADLEGKIKGMEQGADDYLVKPVDGRELLARVKALLAKKSYLDRLHRHYEQAMSSAISDGLTGLYNHGYFKHFIELEIARADRQRYPVSLLMLDLDNFKAINDRHGHPAGDRVLQRMALLLRAQVREVDLVARYGGEEFAVVLPYADAASAQTVAERILTAVRAGFLADPRPDATPRVTASIGLAAYPAMAASSSALIERADEALYRAKAAGRDRLAGPRGASIPTSAGQGRKEER